MQGYSQKGRRKAGYSYGRVCYVV